jgi:hypothetical protein
MGIPIPMDARMAAVAGIRARGAADMLISNIEDRQGEDDYSN